MVYKRIEWREGSRYGASAEVVSQEIARIGGQVTPREVVEVARNDTTELHKCFEWDNTKAAEEYRVEQARGIMRSLVVIEERGPEPQMVSVRAYENVVLPRPKGIEDEDYEPSRAYVPINVALKNKDMRAQVITRLRCTISEAESTIDKYEWLVPEFRNVKKNLAIAKEYLLETV